MSQIEELDGPALLELLGQEGRGVVVDFWSPWCAPCRTLRPHLARLAGEREREWRFVAVNTASHSAAAEDFGVKALPTIAFFRGGQELFRFAGAAALSAIVEKLDEFGTP
jgi:thioredoxin